MVTLKIQVKVTEYNIHDGTIRWQISKSTNREIARDRQRERERERERETETETETERERGEGREKCKRSWLKRKSCTDYS